MTKCPYPETLLDESSGIIVTNEQYTLWHQGYEAHKLDIMTFSGKMPDQSKLVQQGVGKRKT
jgi:hypothetical protein